MNKKQKGYTSMIEPLLFLGILFSIIAGSVQSCTSDEEPINQTHKEEQSVKTDLDSKKNTYSPSILND